ncbi:hypothetical protein EK904_001932 [Melospiza melodia maxima]|nr:hypothetical protein EK904_001932 [Melospiza melodia maxima]
MAFFFTFFFKLVFFFYYLPWGWKRGKEKMDSPRTSRVVPRSVLVQDDVQVQLLACSPGTCLIRQTVSVAAAREETPQGKPFEYKYSISPVPVFVKPGLCCAV